ncbi:carbohydrate ABC transporter permease [Parablautia intestinalis]|jgi:putative aldouronate transport system permease protein|uniref:Carbohydrate ABC transporter permease n=1 Tax=Parablautia intestinalis TaxID=2320100 RepID=A0A3A9AR56_9FIRM|nr:carbohydrate ABC transporter permease [Parablautia intestinalis]MCI8615548.1 carbohydrate ABC transporter permease [Lachnospiraceae bacterium]RKI94020.1 carbohydrate ABC transporter permease [Parablautia intestinalis]
MSKKITPGVVITHTIMIALCVICIVPFLLILVSSFTDESALMMNGYSFFPEKWSTYAYTYILGGGGSNVIHGYFVSIGVTVVGTMLSILMTTLFAYPLSRKDLPFRNVFAFFVFFTMLFNGGLVPSYMMWTRIFHIKNTYAALLFPALLMNAFYVIMMRTYFSTTIPEELIEAARLDGGSEITILWKVVAPLSKPMVATLAFMIGLGYWNDWMNGLYYVTDTAYFSIQNILNRMLQDVQFLSTAAATQASMGSVVSNLPTTGIRMSVAVVGLLPIMIIYPFFQKYLVKGIMIGGVKG